MGEVFEPMIKSEIIRRAIVECDENSLPAIYSELKTFVFIEFGMTERTLKEYLSRLDVVIDGDDVWLKTRWNKILLARELDYNHMKDILSKTKDKYQKELKIETFK
jgi:hypothetical protein